MTISTSFPSFTRCDSADLSAFFFSFEFIL